MYVWFPEVWRAVIIIPVYGVLGCVAAGAVLRVVYAWVKGFLNGV